MKAIQHIGIIIFLIGLGTFAALPFLGQFNLDKKAFDDIVTNQGIKSDIFINDLETKVVDKECSGFQSLAPLVDESIKNANQMHTKNKEWDKKVYASGNDMATSIRKASGYGFITENKWLM